MAWSRRKARRNSIPFPSGRLTSRISRSKAPSSRARRPSARVRHTVTRRPPPSSARWMPRPRASSSSTSSSSCIVRSPLSVGFQIVYQYSNRRRKTQPKSRPGQKNPAGQAESAVRRGRFFHLRAVQFSTLFKKGSCSRTRKSARESSSHRYSPSPAFWPVRPSRMPSETIFWILSVLQRVG